MGDKVKGLPGYENYSQPSSPIGPFPGMISQGNIDLNNRPKVKNKDGSISTVRSMSFESQGKEVLVPTVVGKKVVSNRAAMQQYGKTGQNLGVFDTPAHADMYAKALHKSQEQYYMGKKK